MSILKDGFDEALRKAGISEGWLRGTNFLIVRSAQALGMLGLETGVQAAFVFKMAGDPRVMQFAQTVTGDWKIAAILAGTELVGNVVLIETLRRLWGRGTGSRPSGGDGPKAG